MKVLPRRTLSLLAAVALLVPTLAACSRHTALTVQADLVPFLGSSATQFSVPYLAVAGTYTADLPQNTTDPTGGALVDLTSLGVPASVTAAIASLSLDLAATLTPTTDIGAASATLYLADASASDVFQPQYQVATAAIPALTAHQPGDVTASFAVDAQTDPAALARVQSGSFRIGVEVQGSTSSDGTLAIDVTRLLVGVSLSPGFGLP